MEFPIGIDDFQKVRKGGYSFVDKSLFIKEIMQNGAEVLLITRPRRFGKTLNLSMLYYFLSNNYFGNENLFEGLGITKDEEFCNTHQHQYPAIFITFKDVKEPNFQEASERIEGLIKELYIEHRYLLEGDVLYPEEKVTYMALLNKAGSLDDLKSSIKLLSSYLERKFEKKPIILIDEYDTPIQEAYLKEYYSDMVSLMRGLFGSALKGNKSLEKAIITGITRVAQESLFSGLNNFRVYSVLQKKYGQYFGFSEKEVLKLISDSEQTISIEPIKEWYNGYQIGQYTLYNPWSIINCLTDKGELKPYWRNTSSNDLIKKLLDNADTSIKTQFEQLLQGLIVERPISENLVFPDIEKREEALWSLLLYAGYLKVLSSRVSGFETLAQLAIPNKEVSSVYEGIIAQWFSQGMTLDSYKRFVRSLMDGNVVEFKKELSDYIMGTVSYFDLGKNRPEEVFHMFLVGLVMGFKDDYIIQSNRESGLGRVDVMFIPKDKKRRGILLEFKTSATIELLLEKAQEALKQIKDRKYKETFKQHNISSVLAIGLAFCGKQMELVHENISICGADT